MTEYRLRTSAKGFTYVLDADGARIWDLPPSWSLDKDPTEMCVKELAAAVARLLGCDPEWNGYYGDWCCTCTGRRNAMAHATDSQCSVIADYTRKMDCAREVALWMEKQGYEVPKATATPADICRAALWAVRP